MSCKRLHVLPLGDSASRQVVRLSVDGVEVLARTGESIAAAIVASGRSVFARSVKYHRPRGPYCFAARCDGCLMRVDGVPNVMTCVTDVREGALVETQNVIGSAERDLLSVTDWFFPEGMNHHEMFTATRALNLTMQTIARRVAGIGELPDHPGIFGEREQVPCDVAVIGGGVAGLLAAIEAARVGGVRVVLLEETSAVGGRLGEVDHDIEDEEGRTTKSGAYVQALERLAASVGVMVRVGTSCVAIYDKLVLATDDSHLLELRPLQIVIATGTHDATLPIRGSDLPNVYSLRAAQKLAKLGITLGERVVMIREPLLEPGSASAAIPNLVATYGEHEVDEILGRVRLRGLRLKPRVPGARPQLVRADAVVLAVHPVAEYELGAQAGAAARFDGHSFVLDASALDGSTASDHVHAVGECTGALALARTVEQARRAGKRAGEEARRVR